MFFLGVDILKHLLSIAVIFQHMHSTTRYSIELNTKLTYFTDYIDGAVISFFILSGFFFKQKNSLQQFMRQYSIKILVPFFIFSVLYTILLAVLGKAKLSANIPNILFLHGVGPQLYFLPFLLFISVTYAGLHSKVKKLDLNIKLIDIVLYSFFILISFYFKTDESTGPNLYLMPLYISGFLFGRLYNQFRNKYTPFFILATIIMGYFDSRFYDFSAANILVMIAVSVSAILPAKRFPGSGGVYLMHAPIVNFCFSSLLFSLGFSGESNILGSVMFTYLFCLFSSLIFIKKFPHKKWVLLE
jgi:hypothetical protein